MTRALTRIALTLVLSLAAGACATTEVSEGPDADTGEELCGPDNCSGCCTSGGDCILDLSDDQCGAGGQACAPCGGSEVCDRDSGQCAEPPDCDATTCADGCCSEDDECITPADDGEACGSGGLQCAECDTGAGEVCDGSQCRTPCGPDNCTGCCADDFTCVEGDDVDEGACGEQGGPCEDCDAGAICEGGECREDSCENTCDGCCTAADECISRDELDDDECGINGAPCQDCTQDGEEVCADPGVCVSAECAATCGDEDFGCCTEDGQCRPGDDPDECGAGGDACVDCGPNAICDEDDRECVLDPESEWDIVIENAEVPERREDGSSWGTFGGLPDPYVRVTVDLDGPDEREGETESVDDATFAVYDGEVVLEGVPAEHLTEPGSVLFEWINDNTFFDETMSLPVPILVPEDLFTGELLIWAQEDEYEDAENSPLFFAVRFRLFPSDGTQTYDPASHQVASQPLCTGDAHTRSSLRLDAAAR